MQEVTTENFKDVISKGNVIVDFWAEWCAPCKMIAPVFEELSKEMESVTFAKLNVDEHGEVAATAGVRGIPTLIMYKDGEELGRIVGALPKDQFKQKITDTFQL